jgi:hypothetical protein
MDGAIVALVIFVLLLVLAGIGVGIWLIVRAVAKNKTTCRPGSTAQYNFVRRNWNGTAWGCPPGWEDTTCDWNDGKDLGERQCRILKVLNNPMQPPASAVTRPQTTKPVVAQQPPAAPVVQRPLTVIPPPAAPPAPPAPKTKTGGGGKKKTSKTKTKTKKSTGPRSATVTNTTSGNWQKTNVTYYGQTPADDNGDGFSGVDLFKLGASGLQFNGKRVYPVAVHHDHAAEYLYKVLELRGSKVTPGFLGYVVDICNRSDSSCKNAYKNGLTFLVDIHKTGFEASGNRNNGQDFTTGEFRVVGRIAPSTLPMNVWNDGDKTWAMCKCTGTCDKPQQVWKSVKDFASC